MKHFTFMVCAGALLLASTAKRAGMVVFYALFGGDTKVQLRVCVITFNDTV
ncbi:hypothetical protein [Serratia fonticola]|uniref:hypothetical protein n=1 Tax=Serratia fonticola TaxID=47917 RepID=UPI003AFF6844